MGKTVTDFLQKRTKKETPTYQNNVERLFKPTSVEKTVDSLVRGVGCAGLVGSNDQENMLVVRPELGRGKGSRPGLLEYNRDNVISNVTFSYHLGEGIS